LENHNEARIQDTVIRRQTNWKNSDCY